MPVLGTDANDLLEGIPGADDIIYGGDGDDTLRGGQGDDVLEGGAGADEIDGGEDGGLRLATTTVRDLIWGDTATYVHSDAGVTIDLAMGTAQGGHAEGDTLTGIESVRASDHADMLVARPEGSTLYGQRGNDTLNGGTGIDVLWGGKGDDVLMGGANNWDYLEGGFGADVIDGGDGFDFAGYELSDAGVTIDLETGAAEGGHAEGDTLTGIEGVFGSSHADHLSGDAGGNLLNSGDGDDTLAGGAGDDWQLQGGAGADLVDGGAGFDFANYGESDAGVTVNLATGTAAGGHAEGDTLTGIEGVYGSDHADHLTGDAGNNNFLGADGDDTLAGGAGDDILQSGLGADMLDGGGDHDSAWYRFSDAGVTVNLATGMGHGGEAEGDTLTRIEEVWGSDHADHLTGDAGDNRLDGRGGDDTLVGGAGDDWLNGQAGEDLLTGGEGADTFVFGDGDTVTDFQDGSDLIDIQDFGHINTDNFDTNVTIRQSGDDVEVQIGDAVLTLTGVSAADVTADDFVLA